ncbi:alpha-tectorin-like [Tubulanus polymorphus]|uniref:alpha-tectorin-like n=1 Tax=Tubulanus polymorphus TaxID=672921 RepID=UPI003DA32D4D
MYIQYGGILGPNNYGGRLTGACGNCNGVYGDDDPLTSSCLLGSDNQCVVPGSCPYYAGRRKREAQPEPFVLTEADKTKYGADNFCGLLNKADGPFGECIGANDTTITTTFDNCVFDGAAMRGDMETICSSLSEAETACEEAGHTVTTWRTVDLCLPNCPANSAFNRKMSGCQPTCEQRTVDAANCDLPTVAGCECDAGFIYTASKCIPVADCDICANTNCSNGGECYSVDGKPVCDCPPNFSGDLCEIVGDPCDPNPCQNGGTCSKNELGEADCACTGSFSGPLCNFGSATTCTD